MNIISFHLATLELQSGSFLPANFLNPKARFIRDQTMARKIYISGETFCGSKDYGVGGKDFCFGRFRSRDILDVEYLVSISSDSNYIHITTYKANRDIIKKYIFDDFPDIKNAGVVLEHMLDQPILSQHSLMSGPFEGICLESVLKLI